jgi:hypothetical protein
MRPPSFEDFIRSQREGAAGEEGMEVLSLETCPTPGCNCAKLHPTYENGLLTALACANGCRFIVKRNVFTGDILYFALVGFDETRFDDPASVRGMKFNVLGECYTEWY